MAKEYVVVTIAYGDGASDYGHRISSLRFQTRDAAEACEAWIMAKAGDVKVTIIED